MQYVMYNKKVTFVWRRVFIETESALERCSCHTRETEFRFVRTL